MIWYIRLIPPILVVSLVLCGVGELLYRGWTGASVRWSKGPEEAFELYTYGLPPGSGQEVARLFCGKVGGLPVLVREHSDALELRSQLRYRLKRRPGATLLVLPTTPPGEPTAFEPLVRRSLLLSDVLRPVPELAELRRRLILMARSSGAVPILAGGDPAALAAELEVPVSSGASAAQLAKVLGDLRNERPACAPPTTTGR